MTINSEAGGREIREQNPGGAEDQSRQRVRLKSRLADKAHIENGHRRRVCKPIRQVHPIETRGARDHRDEPPPQRFFQVADPPRCRRDGVLGRERGDNGQRQRPQEDGDLDR